MDDPRSIPRTGVALALSVVLHAVVLLGIPVIFQTNRTSVATPTPTTPDRVTLGAKTDTPVSLAWIAFHEPSPHQATLSETLQPDLTRARPVPAPEPVPHPVPPSQQDAANRADPSPTNRSPDDPTPGPLPRPTESEGQASDQAQADERQAQRPSPTTPEPAEPDPNATTPADRDSDATSDTKPLEYRPGQPLAREGLEIKHIRPDFGTVTRLARGIPKRVLVHISFNKEGWAVRSWIDPKSKTHNRAIDGPIERAIASWTASGEEIDALEGKETVTETVTLIF